jgi:hypothetical protein
VRGSCRIASLAAIAVMSAASCARLTPAGFWARYKPDLIVGRHSDQGPWGGTRWLHWEARSLGTFTAADAVQFAASYGWACEPAVPYTAKQLALWTYQKRPVFPLAFGPADRIPDNSAVEGFPRTIHDDSVVVACASGWIRVDPGTDRSTTAFGHILVNKAGTRMAVYHLWGEI